jgi:hypothetical protein
MRLFQPVKIEAERNPGGLGLYRPKAPVYLQTETTVDQRLIGNRMSPNSGPMQGKRGVMKRPDAPDVSPSHSLSNE